MELSLNKARSPHQSRMATTLPIHYLRHFLRGLGYSILRPFLAGFILLWPAITSPCQPASSETAKVSDRRLKAFRLKDPPEMDGRVNESIWQSMEPAMSFIQKNPKEGEPASENTEVRIGFDDNNLYVGIICFDSQPEAIVINHNRRDGLRPDSDFVMLLLDTFRDGQNAFIFGTSPTGIEHDAQISKAGKTRGGGGGPVRAGGGGAQRGGSSAENLNWDGVWEVRSQITDRGWESEMIIPFRSLRYKPGHNQSWGFNVARNLRRRNEVSHWSPISRAFRFIEANLAGTLYGLDVRHHRNLNLLPYVLGGFSYDYTLSDDPFRFKRNVGLDLKYSLTPSLTLDGTVNTDFAQVEVDDEQVNLTRFDLFFPEKRRFFLENSGFFEFGTPREVEIFFSRRIGIGKNQEQVPLDGGFRLSGKAGPYQLGLLNLQTRKVEDSVPANNYAVVRFSRELPNRSSIGVIGINRQSTSEIQDSARYNRTYGADLNLGLGQFADWFNYVAKTSTPGLQNSDHTYFSHLDYDDSTHEFSLGYLEIGDNFNPEVGFVSRVGFRKPTYFYRYTYYPSKGPILKVTPHFSRKIWYARANNDMESDFQHYHMDSRWHNGSRFGIAWNRNFERLDKPFKITPDITIPAGQYPFSEIIANYQTDPSARIFVSGNAAAGGFYNGNIRSFRLNGGYRYNHNLSWTVSYLLNVVTLPVGDFNTNLVGLRFNWSFTPKSFFQTFTQYNSTTQSIGHNIRLGLLSTSSTGLYIVFNTNNATSTFMDPHSVPRLTLTRAFFIKFNYLFDY